MQSVIDLAFVPVANSLSVSRAWDSHSKEFTISAQSRKYWNNECQATLAKYHADGTVQNWKAFHKVIKNTKCKFFDSHIKEIADTTKRPWDLMEWVKERKNPPCEAIQFNGRPCHELSDLWDTLHNTYNAASDWAVEVDMLDELPDKQVRDWPEFSELELMQALQACSARSAPGPDHITWRHLKVILSQPLCVETISSLANGCVNTGHWPAHFKDSTSVVIPKPGKPSYSTPKAFRPIVLLNTVGKLIEKMISNWFQFDMIKYNLVDPNQMGGVRQRSTEDAGLFLTHLVQTGWAKELQTSVIAFDITQFFPSINHQLLLLIIRKMGFHPKVVDFFASYLVERNTSYTWNNFTSDLRQADIGVGQGSALSPVLSALIVAPIMKLF